jgi:hypothetical protein
MAAQASRDKPKKRLKIRNSPESLKTMPGGGGRMQLIVTSNSIGDRASRHGFAIPVVSVRKGRVEWFWSSFRRHFSR